MKLLIFIFSAILLHSCATKPEELAVKFIEKKFVTTDSFRGSEKKYIFSLPRNLLLKFPNTLVNYKDSLTDYDIIVTRSYPIKQVLFNTEETKTDLCTEGDSRIPVEIKLDTLKKQPNTIFIYKIVPKSKYRNICP
jgi:hypothetical protein